MTRTTAAASATGKKPGRDQGLDLLKAVSILLVTVWHLKPITLVQVGPGKAYAVLQGLNGLFWHEVALLAVPTFYIVSLFLFLRKACGGFQYFRNRTLRLVRIFFFWMAVQCVLFVAVTGSLPDVSWYNFRMGSPGIPGVGHNGFYFIFNLIALNLLANLYARLDARRQDVVDAVVVAASLVFFQVVAVTSFADITHYNLLNFLVYIPLARQLAVRREAFLGRRRLWLGLFAVFALQDALVRQLTGHWPEAYARPTVVFGAMAFVAFVLSRQVRLPRALQLVSLYCLGIYALHIDAGFLARQLVPELPMVLIGNAGLLPSQALEYLVAGVLVAAFIWLLSRTPLREFVH